MSEFLKDFASFLWSRKKFWLWPVILVLLLASSLIVFSGASGLSPFIYTLF